MNRLLLRNVNRLVVYKTKVVTAHGSVSSSLLTFMRRDAFLVDWRAYMNRQVEPSAFESFSSNDECIFKGGKMGALPTLSCPAMITPLNPPKRTSDTGVIRHGARVPLSQALS